MFCSELVDNVTYIMLMLLSGIDLNFLTSLWEWFKIVDGAGKVRMNSKNVRFQ
jgi:hypothetical protein